MRKKIAILFLLFLVIVTAIYFYLHQDFRNIANEKAAFFVTATVLENDFNANDSLANVKYLDKAISVKGKISNIDLDNNAVEIDNKILAVFKDSIQANFVIDHQISIKGRFVGYDELFDQFRLDQVVLEP